MPSIGIESLSLFIYEEIATYCDNKTFTQLVSVSGNFYNWFSGSHLKKFRMHNHLHLVTYWSKGLLSERSPRFKTPTPLYIYDTSTGLPNHTHNITRLEAEKHVGCNDAPSPTETHSNSHSNKLKYLHLYTFTYRHTYGR